MMRSGAACWRTAISNCRCTLPTWRNMSRRVRRSIRKRGCAAPAFTFPIAPCPMLPLELSTDICSLRPQVDRLVMSCVMEIDHRGEIVGYELSEGVIRSAERMTYTAVNAVLEGDAGAGSVMRALVPSLS